MTRLGSDNLDFVLAYVMQYHHCRLPAGAKITVTAAKGCALVLTLRDWRGHETHTISVMPELDGHDVSVVLG